MTSRPSSPCFFSSGCVDTSVTTHCLTANMENERIMGLFDFFRRRSSGVKDFTQEWIEDPSHELAVHFDDGSLGGVPVGRRFEELRWLGRANSLENDEIKVTFYNFRSKGIRIVKRGRLFVQFSLYFEGAYVDHPIASRCYYRERELVFSSETTAQELIGRFGEPVSRGVSYLNNDFRDYHLVYHWGKQVTFIFPLPDEFDEETDEIRDLGLLCLTVSDLSNARRIATTY